MTSGLLRPGENRGEIWPPPNAGGVIALPTRLDLPLVRRTSSDDDAVERAADASALHSLLAPRSIAVVGAGRRHGGVGHETLRALREYDFRGRLFAVNRSGRPASGVPAYRSVADLPTPVDLLVLAVPAHRALPALRDAGRRGTRVAVLLEAGWDVTTPEAARQRDEVVRVAHDQHIRLLGPGSLGVLNADPGVRLNASLAPVRPPSGGLAIAARSGGLGIALLQAAIRDRCGVSTFVSVGDETDITTSQLLDYWRNDPATRGVLLSHEPTRDPAGFAYSLHALARVKPVVEVTIGQPSAIREDLVGQGPIRIPSLASALDAARMLVDQPLPAGNRIAIVGNAGDLTMLAAAAARAHGFDVVSLSGVTRAQLPRLAGALRCGNPLDLGIEAAPARIAAAAETIAHSDEVDVLLLILIGTRANVLAAITSAVGPVLDDHPSLTVAVVMTGDHDDVHQLGDRGAPVFQEPELAVRALASSFRYAQWRQRALGRPRAAR